MSIEKLIEGLEEVERIFFSIDFLHNVEYKGSIQDYI